MFKWQQDDEPSGSVVQDSRLEEIFFAKQVINNACATQAIVSVLLNTHDANVDLGPTLGSFKDFTAEFDSTMKGLALSNSDTIKEVHNSFSRHEMVDMVGEKKGGTEDVFHFISYLPISGRLYELDGLKDGPIDLGAVPTTGHWIDLARPVIEKRIKKYQDGEIHFNLMALISDRKQMYEKQLAQLTAQLDQGMETDSIGLEINHVKDLIKDEELKAHRYKLENIRRKHNYLPLIIEVLKGLGQEGQLTELVNKAKDRALQVKKLKDEKAGK